MSNFLKEIIDHFNNNHLDEALNLCEASNEKKIAHLITNIKGAILFKQQNYELAKKGYRFLPFRSKICISIAANIYREIGIIIKKNNYQLSNKRYYVSKRRKFIISLKTILGFA